MAKKPTDVRWAMTPHTAAKHQILKGYLDAWVGIMGMTFDNLVLIDGFAGPGRYLGDEPGSPLLMLDAYAGRSDRRKLKAQPHFFFIEADKDRFDALCGELARYQNIDDIEVHPIHGVYDEEFPRILKAVQGELPKIPKAGVFAFIDPFGGQHEKLELTNDLLAVARCEALIFVPVGHFGDLFHQTDMRHTIEAVFGPTVFKKAEGLGATQRKTLLVKALEQRLRQNADYVRAFELIGARRYFLFFATSSKKGLARMKESMWKVDPEHGAAFSDSTLPDHPVLFEPKPDFQALEKLLVEHFADRVFSIEEAECFVLADTPFRHDGHLKERVLAPAERSKSLVAVCDKRSRKCTYPPGTKLQFVPRQMTLGES